MEDLKKIAHYLIYGGIVAALASPLFVDSSFFFPFVTTKAFIFRTAVQLMILAYLFLVIYEPKYRPRINALNLILTIFLIVSFVSSLLGPDFYRSFWGDIERSEGLLMWLHLWAFFVITGAVVQSRSSWYKLLDLSIVVAILISVYGFAQVLGLESILNTTGTRVASAIGNAAFLAAYLLFHIFFALYFIIQRKGIGVRIYYIVASLFFAYIILATQTRGAAVGFAAGFIVSAFLFMIIKRKNTIVRNLSAGFLVLMILSVTGIYLFKDTGFIKDSRYFQRLADISLETRTAQTRLATWGAAWEGIKERPILGWGLENFNVVFNKHFPTIIYEDEGSVVWFDRAHNLIFDRTVTGGFVGLILFLSFLFIPIYYLFRNSSEGDSNSNAAILVVGFIVAYLVQDLFVFESVVTFILLFFTYAFFQSQFVPQGRIIGYNARQFWIGSLAIFAVCAIPVFLFSVFYPAQANLAASRAMRTPETDENFLVKVDRFKQALEKGTYGQEEYRIQMIESVGVKLSDMGTIQNPLWQDVVSYTDQQLDQQLAEAPVDAKNYLLAMRNYNYTKASLPNVEESRILKSLEYYSKAVELSPTRPHIHQEAGYSNYHLYKYYIANNRLDDANKASAEAERFFEKTISINPKVAESYINLVMLYLETGDDEKIKNTIKRMDDLEVRYKSDQHLSKIQQLAVQTESWYWVAFFSEELYELNNNNINALINAAVAYAHLGNREEALRVAEKVRMLGEDYEDDAKVFIERVNNGYYEKRP